MSQESDINIRNHGKIYHQIAIKIITLIKRMLIIPGRMVMYSFEII
jgi:hypothetical protein